MHVLVPSADRPVPVPDHDAVVDLVRGLDGLVDPGTPMLLFVGCCRTLHCLVTLDDVTALDVLAAPDVVMTLGEACGAAWCWAVTPGRGDPDELDRAAFEALSDAADAVDAPLIDWLFVVDGGVLALGDDESVWPGLVNGVWAGDPNKLSARYAFPRMYALERDHGSLIRGAIAAARTKPRRSRAMFAMRDGNESLVRALASRLTDLRVGTPVQRVSRQNGRLKIGRNVFDQVVLSTTAHQFPNIDVDGWTAADTAFAHRVTYPWLSVTTFGFRRDQVRHPLDGFGVISPLREGFDFLGALFTSTLFPGRAPAGHVTIACFVGGARRPDMAALPADERHRKTLTSLAKLLGVNGEPVFMEDVVHQRAIPQVEVGFGRNIAHIDALERRTPGIRIAGSLRGRVAVPDLIDSAITLADRIMEQQ